jgi:catechol 2,3-dioxygenase-like lactoylglutathione lyase family enzyme
MLSHVSLGTNDAERAAAFYDPVLAVLGMRKICERDGSIDYGTAMTVFSLEKPSDGKPASVGNGVHIAFAAGPFAGSANSRSERPATSSCGRSNS